ncbi:helix-turn-helix transcriptional regulator [Leucobacter insecticola]|uniref:Helix-turn-helix transcriptional regulator n=1 Tax=Leucobacter insecticola TaxID=2714934 RepID=A0A6G8FFY8_9MICO|nr:helix-turn-helix domain-containing protein [Leucobacter insecticola]QIM15426.1 helix-turn-helix transcriptional regulator [Leucobacter insecticola]
MSTDGQRSENTGNPESLSVAAKALAKATSQLAKAMSEQAADLVPEIKSGIASSLKEASETLSRAAERAQSQPNETSAQSSKAARTRAEIIHAAREVFATQGIERASMVDIAKAAGFTKGAIYANFASKQDLILAVARSTNATANDAAAAEASPCGADSAADTGSDSGHSVLGTPEGDIDTHTLTEWLRASLQNTRMLLALELIAYGIRHPELRDEFADYLGDGLTSLTQQVANLRRTRAQRSGTPPRTAAPAGTPTLPDCAPDQGDTDTAVAVMSVANQTGLLHMFAAEPATAPEAGARIIAALLSANDRGA